jgi:uncharacterized membrane protein
VYTTAGASRAHGAATYSTGETQIAAGAAGRMTGIDAARGIAMVLVCLSHIRYHFDESVPALYSALTNLTRLATPTFLLLSGFVAAYVLSSDQRKTRIAMIDRGLFILLAGHLLLSWADLPAVGFQEWLFARITVTDAIAICLIVAALSSRLPTALIAAAGATLMFASWPVAMRWAPESDFTRSIAIMLFDAHSEASELTDAALLPYLGLFLVGMSLSRWCSEHLAARDYVSAARKLFALGASAIAIVIAAILVWRAVKPSLLGSLDAETIALAQLTLDPRSKLPPSPAYLVFYGGGGLLIAATCLVSRPAVLLRPIVAWAATLGRASMMCFVAQEWMLVVIPALFGFSNLQSPPFWTGYWLAAVIALHALATQWDRARANRFLTVGLKRSYAAKHAEEHFSPLVGSRTGESRPSHPR